MCQRTVIFLLHAPPALFLFCIHFVTKNRVSKVTDRKKQTPIFAICGSCALNGWFVLDK
jgi:hypothetical protein